ncbi:WD repeat-containing protein 86 [Phytophthora pseudosyringae]|uniref:WD repeat-containing protein 86 n=1 Tax=Phytophthora pseudosyringae TaxID=221518 RepID=A0A8T1WKW4_9STRA|nr:WD repeat-containing protein 86 [Phytophthora pseudosyringae]
MSGATVFEEASTPASLSPTRAALASASEKAAAKPGQVIVGPLRIRVLQAIDLPTPRVVENGTLTTSSWLHFPGRRPSQHQAGHGKAQHEVVPDTICVLLQAANSGVFATEARPWASAICWDEEFYMEKVSSSDELILFCVDRARDETHASLPLQGEISACPGFIGKVTLPLTRLPEGQEVEQWYPLVPKESSSALRTALRVSLCFVPNGVSVPVTQSPERRRVTPTSALPPSPATEISSPSPVSKQLRVDIPEAANSAAIPLESGIIDYVIVVGTAANSDIPTSLDEAQVRFRYPLTDRHNFPLPTKIEWFCFPGGPEIITQAERPQSKLFSFVLSMLENGRPEHLVVVDIDRGTIQLQESGGPVLPHKLATALHHSLKTVLHPSLYGDTEDNRRGSRTSVVAEESGTDNSLDELKQEVEKEQCTVVEWGPDTEKQVRMEFVCFLSSLVRGYRECLFFVNQKLPVFNKRRFFESESTDNEVVPLVTRLLCTQAFQAFLESHSSAELSVFHSVYLTLCRGPKELQWSQSIRALTASKSQHSFLDSGPARTDIPVLLIEDASTNKTADDGDKCGSDDASELKTPRTTCSLFNDEDIGTIEIETSTTLGKKIEALLNEESAHPWDPFALETSDVEALSTATSKSLGKLNHEFIARKLGVEPKLLKVNAHLLQNAHQVNQYRLHLDSTVAAALAGSVGPGGRFLSSEDERIEQMLHKCLTAVFTSDDSLTEQEIRACEAHFKSGHARDLFVLILMQPNNQYVERVNGSPKASGTKSSSAWYNPKGSGSCIGAAGFRLLTRLTSALMKQCAIQEDYSTARGILQVAPQYYHYVEDKHSGIGFAKKEYLVTPLRLLPICRSLDLWQHAFICEIDAANQVDPTESDEEGPETVGDELFFSVIGSLMYDMLNFEVPLQKVLTFVTVMCSTYQKGQDLLDTLKQLAENVYRALDLSKDIKPSPPKDAVQPRINAKSTSNHAPAAPSQIELLPKTANGAGSSSSTAGVAFTESPMLSREYDLNTVIRRKMSVQEMPQHGHSTFHAKTENRDGDRTGNGNQYAADWMSRTPPTRRRRSSAVFPSAVLTNSGSPVLCLATDGGRAACGMADAHVNVVDIDPSEEDKGITLGGHNDAVVAVQMRGNALISGSRDHTLRAWDLRATPKKRNMFAFFSMAYATGSSNTMTSTEDSEVDGASVSKRSLVMRGHLDAITCMELGHQLGVGRSLLASGSDDGTVRLWETTKESSVALLSGHKGTGKPADHGGVSCLRLLSSDDDLALGYRRRTLQIWDLAACKLKVNVEAHQAGVRDLQVSGTRLVTAANDRVVKVWDTAFRGTGGTMQPVQVLRGHGGPVQCVSLGGPADPTICTGAADGLVRVWDLRYVQRGPRLTLRGHTGPVTRLQRDFTKLVSAGEDGWLRVWDMHSGLCLREKQVHTSGVTCLEMRDSLVYSGSWDGSVRVWDIEKIDRFVLTARGCTSSYSFIPKRHSERMPKVAEFPARLQSLDSLSPLSSPASSLPSVYSPGPVAAAREKKTVSLANQTRKRQVKPKARQTKIEEVRDGRDSFGTTASLSESHNGECLLNGQITDKDGDQTAIRNEDENSSWPVLVAVRCRPRKRQRTKGRFATVLGADDEVQHSGSLDSSSASSSGDDDRGSNDRSSSGSVQRGVFEYSTCRDYDHAATYDAKIPPPRMQRPRRLYVQAPGDSGGSTSGRRSFDFDFIFPPWKKQRDVYDMCVHAQIRHVLQSQRERRAQHATIVAYGQTGTGKTYTMGMLSDFRDDKEQGLIPRALSQVLEFAGNSEDEANSHQTVVTMSFLQIYLETIQDLLALPGSKLSTIRGKPRGKHDARRHCNASSNDLPVRQGRDGAFYVTNLNEYEISSIEDAHALLELAMRNRVLAATTKNKTSSRSHTLLTISIKRRRHGPSRSRYSSSEDEDDDLDEDRSANEEDAMKKASTISFVDLAGSERVDGALHFLRATRTRQEQRIREAKFINRSLSALGGVIAALAQPKPAGTGATSANVVARLNSGLREKLQHPVGNEQARPHIRFRDSQLTKLLQGRLMGGRGRLLLIATVDDQPKNLSETLSTLKFAAQCRRVELQPGSRLRGDRANRLGRQKSLLDQVFNDMKTMHENREAALHSEYQARIAALEGELEAARAAALSSPHSTPEDVASIHLASYTALCSLVDTICTTDDHSGESQHPNAVAFESEKDLLEYVAGLYSRLKEALIVQQQEGESPATPVATAGPVSVAKTNPASLLQPAVKDQRYDEHKHELPLELAANEQEVPREPVPTPTPSTVYSSARRARTRIQLSPEQEAEFRAVARHLITTRALDSFIASSSSDEDE